VNERKNLKKKKSSSDAVLKNKWTPLFSCSLLKKEYPPPKKLLQLIHNLKRVNDHFPGPLSKKKNSLYIIFG